jgi:hypothetical protein
MKATTQTTAAARNDAQRADLSGLRGNINVKAHRLEDNLLYEYVAIIPVGGHGRTHSEPVTLRIYSRTGAKVTACVWVSSGERYGAGSGYASGYGYHKASAAAGSAIESAGIRLSKRIDGVGDDAIRQAVEAIATAITGKRRVIIHVAHG